MIKFFFSYKNFTGDCSINFFFWYLFLQQTIFCIASSFHKWRGVLVSLQKWDDIFLYFPNRIIRTTYYFIIIIKISCRFQTITLLYALIYSRSKIMLSHSIVSMWFVHHFKNSLPHMPKVLQNHYTEMNVKGESQIIVCRNHWTDDWHISLQTPRICCNRFWLYSVVFEKYSNKSLGTFCKALLSST